MKSKFCPRNINQPRDVEILYEKKQLVLEQQVQSSAIVSKFVAGSIQSQVIMSKASALSLDFFTGCFRLIDQSTIVYDTDNLHNVTFVKNLLEYSDDYSRSVGKNSLWYLDTDDTTANTNLGFQARKVLTQAGNINIIIPLNRWSFFEELNDKMLVPMQLQFNIELNSDDELVHMANGVDDARVVINRFILWVPRLSPRDSVYDKFVSSFLKETQWKYMREMYNVSAPTNTSGFFQISSSIDNVKHIFIYLKNSYRDDNGHRHAETTPFKMDTFSLEGGASLNNCRSEYGNGVFYPETEYDSESKSRIFNDVMAYAMRKND